MLLPPTAIKIILLLIKRRWALFLRKTSGKNNTRPIHVFVAFKRSLILASFVQNVLLSCRAVLWFRFLGGCIPIDFGTAYLFKYPFLLKSFCFIGFRNSHASVITLAKNWPRLTVSNKSRRETMLFSNIRERGVRINSKDRFSSTKLKPISILLTVDWFLWFNQCKQFNEEADWMNLVTHLHVLI